MLTVQVALEPNDYAHRNYCAEGAIAVLLSVWTTAVPTLDAIGVAADVNEATGTIGANAVAAINGYLHADLGTSAYDYTGVHVTSLTPVIAAIQSDIGAQGVLVSAGHGTPVLVHVETGTLPGWDGYRAAHMVAIYGYDFTSGNPATETVTYAESAGSVAGYDGPHTETISLDALWTAMSAYNADVPSDPVSLIRL
jgi:hypothetical protein